MAAAEHIRTQIRKAFKAHLSAAIGDNGPLRVHYASRIVRSFQADNFPMALIAVTDNPSPASNIEVPGNRRINRDVTVQLKISERTAFEDVEDRIDTMCVTIEKALANPGDIGFGKYTSFLVGATSAPELEPLTEDTLLMSVVIPVTFTVVTLDSDPTKNLCK